MDAILKNAINFFVTLLEELGHEEINKVLEKKGWSVSPTETDITAKDGREPCPKGYVRNSHGDCVPDV